MTESLFDLEPLNCLDCGRPLNDGRCGWCSNLELPALPYAGTSGWSGSDTSRARAVTDDRSGKTTARQMETLRLLGDAGVTGMTWTEMASITGEHHGQVTGALSTLHKKGHIARLSESRQRCKVYVLPEHVNGRDTESHGRKPRVPNPDPVPVPPSPSDPAKPCLGCGSTDHRTYDCPDDFLGNI
jgi:hypothetical protein